MKNNVYLPLIFAVIPATVIILLLPPMFERYELIAEEQHLKQKDNAYILYHDIDNDGTNEIIQGIDSEIGKAAILIYQHDGELLGQYNYPGKFPFRNHLNIWTSDYNHDSIAEIYFFTQRHDSVFMQIMSVKDKYDPVFKREVFIDTTSSTKDGLHDFGASIYEFRDVNKDGKKEVLFTIRGYYTHLPRKTGVYDVANDQLKYSQNFAAKPGIHFLEFSSGQPVFLVVANSSANVDDPNPYYGSDLKDQLFLLDKDLGLLKGPVVYGEYHSSKYSKIIPEKQQIFTINIPDNRKNNKARLNLTMFDFQLNVIEKDSLLLHFELNNPNYFHGKPDVVYGDNNKLFVIDPESMQLKETIKHNYPVGRKNTQINLDHDKEMEVVGLNASQIYVLDNQMKTMTAIPVNLTSDHNTFISKIPGQEHHHKFLVQNNDKYHIYSYHENDAYVFQYPFYLMIYILSAAFTYGVTELTRRNADRKQRLERDMLNLQLKSTRNQASPHFTYNLLNTISAAILHEDKEKAHNMVTSMGQLMRSSLENSEKVERPLKKELLFVENYLSLEKQRFNSALSYEIEVADDVNTEVPVPKMLLQIFVENAIKHGIRNLHNKKGKVRLTVENHHHQIVVKITDNGIGREKAKKYNTESSKEGLNIVDKIIHLHKRLSEHEISYEINDFYDDNTKPAGTQVIIHIPQKQ